MRIDIGGIIDMNRAFFETVWFAGFLMFRGRMDKNRNSVEHSQYGAERAGCSAERAAADKRERYHARKDADLKPEPPSDHAHYPETRSENVGGTELGLIPCPGNDRDTGFKRPGRAERAEERFFYDWWNDDNEHNEGDVFPVTRPMGETVFFNGYPADEILKKAERAEMSAVKPARHKPENPESADCDERDRADNKKMLNCSDRACPLCERTCITIQHWYG